MGTLHAELLRTKVRVPPLRSGMVARSRLQERLQEGSRGKLTLVAAGAGAGKTTLLSQWVDTAWFGKCAWVSLDSADSDPHRFLHHVAMSLSSVAGDLWEEILGALRSSHRPAAEDVAAGLLARTAEIPHEILVVLDDFHVLRGEDVPRLIPFLLQHTPPHVHWVIASRSVPSFSLSRLRVDGDLVELGDEALAFTDDEARSYFKDVHHLGLSGDDVALLGQKTEGWVAGLQMAALTLRDALDPKAFVEVFSGEVGIIGDYLVDEVLTHQSDEVLGFLRRTALLEQMTGSLCDAVTGGCDCQERLEAMERANLFVVPLDPHRRWYRYHHLFAELLQARYPLTEDEIVETRARAGRWFEAEGDFEIAIHYAVGAREWDRVGRLILLLFERNDVRVADLLRLSEWVETFLGAVDRPDPEFLFGYAWCLLQSGEWDRAGRWLDRAEIGWQESGDPKIGAVSAARSVIALRRGQSGVALREAREAARWMAGWNLSRCSRREVRIWLLCRGQLGVSLLSAGLPREAMGPLNAVNAVASSAALTGALNAGTSCLQHGYWMLGRLGESRRVGEQRLKTVDGEACGIRYWMAVVDYEQNRLEEAETLLVAAREHARRRRREEQVTKVTLALARVYRAQGQSEEARCELQHSRYLSRIFTDRNESRRLEATAARFALIDGRGPEVERWMAELLPIDEGSFDYPREGESLVLVEALIHRRRFTAALELLTGLRLRAERDGRRRSVVAVAAHQALLRQAQGKGGEAQRLLQEALELGMDESYVRIFVDLGPPMHSLLSRRRDGGKLGAYVKRLLTAFRPEETGSRGQASQLIEPLSDRELEVAQLLGTGLTNVELARRLHISANTLKTHLKRIYVKLGVSSRAQATAKLMVLDLVPIEKTEA